VSDLEANLPALQREARQLLRWAANPTTNPKHSRAFFEANQEGVHDGGEWLEVNVVQLGGGPLNKGLCSGDSGYGGQKGDLLAALCYVMRKHQQSSVSAGATENGGGHSNSMLTTLAAVNAFNRGTVTEKNVVTLPGGLQVDLSGTGNAFWRHFPHDHLPRQALDKHIRKVFIYNEAFSLHPCRRRSDCVVRRCGHPAGPPLYIARRDAYLAALRSD
jgi:hypothetical protein